MVTCWEVVLSTRQLGNSALSVVACCLCVFTVWVSVVRSCLGLVCLFAFLLPQSLWNVPLVLRPLDHAESARVCGKAATCCSVFVVSGGCCLAPSTRCRGQEAERKRVADAEANRKRAEAAAQVCCCVGVLWSVWACQRADRAARHDAARHNRGVGGMALIWVCLWSCLRVLSGWVFGAPGGAAASSSSSSSSGGGGGGGRGGCQGGAWLWSVLQANADADDAGAGGYWLLFVVAIVVVCFLLFVVFAAHSWPGVQEAEQWRAASKVCVLGGCASWSDGYVCVSRGGGETGE